MSLPRTRQIIALARLRMLLLLRQKLGWVSVVLGTLLTIGCYLVAEASFVNPLKIYWDFTLGLSFVMQMLLAIYLSTQLFADESSRKTLHLLLSSGLSRGSWLVGNAAGVACSLLLMNVLWLGVSLLVALTAFEGSSVVIQLQCQWLVFIETLIVISLSFLLSFIVRPVIALVASAIATLFLHSLSSIQRIFTDPNSGRYVEDRGIKYIMWAARVLPPLEWFDLRSFVGYRDPMSSSFMAQMTLVGVLWAAFLGYLGWRRFSRMDL